MKKEELFRAAGVIAGASIISKILGYVREASIAAVFGANRFTDAYLVASIIPWMLFSVVGAALTMTLIPVYTKRVYEAGEEAGERFINSLLNFVFIFCLVMAGLGALLAPFLVRVVAPGFRGETFELTVILTRILLPVMIFLGLQAVLAGFLQAREKFFWPAIAGIPFNIVMISAVFLGGRRYGIMVAAVGMLLATLIQVLVMAPGMAGCRFRYRPLLNLRDAGMLQIGRLILPILLATGAGQLGLVVDRMLASGLAEGSIAALNFGNLVTQLPLGIFSVAINTVLYPTFARSAAARDLDGLRRALVEGVRAILFLIMPTAVGLIILRAPIVRLLLERGAFDPRATAMTSCAVLFFSIGLIPMALRDAVNRVYFSLQDTITPMLLGIGAVAVNIALNLLLIRPLALGGLALSTSLSAAFAVILLLWSLRRRLGGSGGREILDGFWRTAVASAVMGLAVIAIWKGLNGLASGGVLLYAGCLGLTICAGVVIYGVAAVLLHLPEVRLFLDLSRNLFWRLHPGMIRENASTR